MVHELNSCSDEELVALVETSEEATEALITRYTKLVRICARPLFLAGADHEDLVQEGMIGLIQAMRTYSPKEGVPFAGYAAVCIRSRMISAVRSAAARKHAPLNNSLSMQDLFDSAVPFPCLGLDPESDFIRKEGTRQFLHTLYERLSPGEREVLRLYLEGISYREISRLLDKSEKSVDNSIQRIRRKASILLGEDG